MTTHVGVSQEVIEIHVLANSYFICDFNMSK